MSLDLYLVLSGALPSLAKLNEHFEEEGGASGCAPVFQDFARTTRAWLLRRIEGGDVRYDFDPSALPAPPESPQAPLHAAASPPHAIPG